MPEPATPAPAPVPPAKAKAARSPISKELLAELQLATAVAAAAVKADYATQLAKRDIAADYVAELQADIAAAQTLAGQTVGKTAAKQGVTSTEAELKDTLVERLQEVQKAAKQKSVRTGDKTLPKKYGIGSKFSSSRALLEQTADSFLENLKTDTLPGIDAAAVTAIKDALADYRQVQAEQTGAKSGATTGRAGLEAAVAAIARRRREIQLAADAAWPASKKANAGIRGEFGLPPDKALK
jgi:hypothetical protein